MNTVGPTIASLPTYIQSPRNIVVPSIDVIFSEPIDPTTFTYQDITYSKEGGPNLITPSITITQISPTEFEISNFNNLIPPIDGTYTFTVSAAGVKDLAGNTGTGSASDTWVLLTTAPVAPTDLAISPNTGATPGLTDTGAVTLTGTLSESGLAIDVMDGTTDLGFATVNGTTFSIALNLPAGANQLEVTADDAAGNVSPSASFNVFVDESLLTISSVAAVTPNPRNTAVGSVDVTFTKPINAATFTTADLTLTDNGGPNLITSAVTISLVSGTTSTYQIGGLSGLTTAEGTYVLTVDAAGIQDQVGNAGTGSLSTSWLMDTTPPTSHVNSLPATTTSTSFTVSVTATDPNGANGSTPSGVASIAIYDSTNGGPFTLFTTVTPSDPSATFTGQVGNTYAFYSVATDKAGNVEATPTAAQASTTVEATRQATSISTISGSGTYGGTATLTATLTASSGSGLADESVTFAFVNGTIITTVGTATTNADGVATLTGVSLTGIGAGTYTGYVGASFAGDANYDGSSGSGDLTVAQAPLTVTANPAFKTYGDADPTFTVSYNGFVDGDGVSSLSGSLSFATTEPTTSYAPVASYTITPSGLVSSNYSITYIGGTLTVNPRALTVTAANNAIQTYGAPTPTLTYTLSGFAPGEDAMIAGVTGAPVLSTTATQSSGVATYAITVGAGTLAAANYDFPNLVAGTLTITPAPLTITADDQSMVYGAPLPVLTASYSGFVNGDAPANLATPVTLSTDATSSSPVGTYAIQAFGATSANYKITFVNGTLTINQASTTTTLAASVNPSVFGQSVTFTATVAAAAPGSGTPTGTISFMEGSNTLDTESLDTSTTVSFTTSALAVGSATITAVYSGDTDFLTSGSSTTDTINQASTATSLFALPTLTTSGETVTLTATIAVVAAGCGHADGLCAVLRRHDLPGYRHPERQHRHSHDDHAAGRDRLAHRAIPGRLQLHRQHVERCLGHDQPLRHRHDHHPHLLL